jgi:hypothetical protein
MLEVKEVDREEIEAMSDSEKLTEILILMRGVQNALEAMGRNPAISAMFGM